MKSAFLRVFLALPLFASSLAFAESSLEIQSRCDVLRKQIEFHNEDLKRGAVEANLYSLPFRFDAFKQAAKLEVPKETQEYVKSVSNLDKQIEANEGPKGAAKDVALLTAYKEMNTHIRKLFAEADALYPECQLLKSSTEPNRPRVLEKKVAPTKAQQ
ncbi:hypothetical protein D3C72_1373520 [compost metagenome]